MGFQCLTFFPGLSTGTFVFIFWGRVHAGSSGAAPRPSGRQGGTDVASSVVLLGGEVHAWLERARRRHLGRLLLLGALVDQGLVDVPSENGVFDAFRSQKSSRKSSRTPGCVRDDTAARDRGLDERVELLVAADGELEVARRDALHLEVLAGVARELEHLGREVLEDGGRVDGGRGADLRRATRGPRRRGARAFEARRDRISSRRSTRSPCPARVRGRAWTWTPVRTRWEAVTRNLRKRWSLRGDD